MRLGWFLALLLLFPTMAHAGSIEGRVVSSDGPVGGIRVEAYKSLDFSGEPLARSAPTDAEGRYRLELPAGRYALFARDPERALFAFCGRNPVGVAEGTVWAGLQAVPLEAPTYLPYPEPLAAAVEGRVLLDGRPLAGAHVYLYLDAAEDLKGQGFRRSPPTGADGAFAFDGLPESGYFLVARWRQSGGRVGPVAEGDALALYAGNPLAAVAGQSARVTLQAVRKAQETAEGAALLPASGMVLRGTVSDPQGWPAAGVHVFAYTDRVIGHQRPEALSPPTGADGTFTVVLKRPGTYYVGARELYGDSPAPGERFGMYDDTADHGITIEAGVVEGVKIVVEPISLH